MFHDNTRMRMFYKNVWLPRLIALSLLAVAGLSIGFWVQQWRAPTVGHAQVSTVPSALPVAMQIDTPLLERALGALLPGASPAQAEVAPTPEASRYALAGVVAGSRKTGAALISIDGALARPVTVGSAVGTEWVLHSVQGRRAVLVRPAAAGAAEPAAEDSLVLEMPLPAQAATP